MKALFVDLGGVLADEGFVPGVRSFAKKQSFDPDALYAACHDGTWKEFTKGLVSEAVYLKAVQANFPKPFVAAQLREEVLSHTVLHHDVYDFLVALKGKYILGIISNHPAEWYGWLRQQFHLDDLFSVEAVSGLVHVRKPDPKIFQYALDHAQVRGEEALYVDDAEKHFVGARAVGMHTALYTGINDLRKILTDT